jgi:cytochrome o ubiquinol oxidase operon protein cyoD
MAYEYPLSNDKKIMMASNGANDELAHSPLAHATIRTYVVGYVLSLVCTLSAFGLMQLHEATGHLFPTHPELWSAFVILAIVQLIVQVILFLHLGKGSSARWNIIVLSFAAFIVFALVGGTLWIMSNLQHNDMNNGFIHGVITPQTEND